MREQLLLIGLLLSTIVPLMGQDIDANLSVQSRSPSTVAGQILDLEEREAFIALFQPASPSEMLEHANAFLERFPGSAFLAQAYDVVARAHFDLGNYNTGLDSAEKSLILLPENPILLVSVADVEARQHLNQSAISHARDAIDQMDRFAAPGSMNRENWPGVKDQLQARARFAIGRALLAQALDLSPGDERNHLLNSCKDSLVQAQRLNPKDNEVAYLLGLAYLAAHEPQRAADVLAVVYERDSDFASQAEKNLRAIHRAIKASPPVEFDVFVSQAAQRGRLDPLGKGERHTVDPDRKPQPLPEYAGSSSCRSCHAEIYREWTQTGMARMLRPYAPQNVIGDFQNNNQFFLGDDVQYREGKLQVKHDPEQILFARMLIRDGRHYFEIHGEDGKSHIYPVDYTIGSKFQQAYATRLPNGQIHVFPIQYSAIQKRWINYWKIIDTSGSERADLRSWQKLDAATSYQAVCAVCHTSQLRNVSGGGFDVDNVEFREPGIDCEMCHGPSETHVVETNLAQLDPKPALSPPVNFHGLSTRDSVRICAQCHMQSAIRSAGSGGELNYSRFGSFALENPSIPFGEFSRKGFYKDGRFRQTTFIVEAMQRSKCFKGGKLSCTSCHNPHDRDSANNPTSLKFRDQPDLICTGCHKRFTNPSAVIVHTHHPITSDGSRCVSCHMPRIMDAVLFRARTHQIDDIPAVRMTKLFGQEESPNACLLCHSDKSIAWLENELQSWKPGE